VSSRIHRLFGERAVIAAIVLDTIAQFVMASTHPQLTQMASLDRAGQIHDIASWVDYGCVVYFVIEAITKIRPRGFRDYWSSGWNRFDFIVVLLSAPALLSPILPLRELSVFLVLRIGRVFRLFRVMRFIPHADHLYSGVQRALRASVGVFIALSLVNLVFALGATQLFGRAAPQYFGNPALSIYSIFRVFTLEGWADIPDAIAANSSWVLAVIARIYFVIAVTVGGLLGISLANAVFVDEMTMDNTDELEAKIDRLLEQVAKLEAEIKARR